MTDINLVFSRAMLSRIHKDVKAFRPTINLRKDGWVWRGHRGRWEFHGPDGFYEGSLRADNAYHAKYIGWSAWLTAQGAPGYARARL